MSRTRPPPYEPIDTSNLSDSYDDEQYPEMQFASRRGGAGEAEYCMSEEDSFPYHNQPTEHGDYNQRGADFFNDTHVNEVDLPFYGLLESISEEDEEEVDDSTYWIDDSSRDSSLRYRSINELDVTDSDGDESYVSVNRFLSQDDPTRDDWYEDPRGEDFRKAFACLKNSKLLAKKYLLDILGSGSEDDGESSDEADLDPDVQDQVTYALGELLIPGLAKMSVEKLCDLLVTYPTLDLRGYLVDMDVFYVAYIIFGIDFYMTKKYGGFIVPETSASKINEEERPLITGPLKNCWRKSVGWLFESPVSESRDCKREVSYYK